MTPTKRDLARRTDALTRPDGEYPPAGMITILSGERSGAEFETVDADRRLIRLDGVTHKLTENIRAEPETGDQ